MILPEISRGGGPCAAWWRGNFASPSPSCLDPASSFFELLTRKAGPRIKSGVTIEGDDGPLSACPLWVETDHRRQYAGEMGTAAILRPVTGLLLAVAAVACGSASTKRPITVDEFISEIDRLNGRTVTVTGYLGECEGHSCRLYRNKAESDEVDRAMTDMQAALAEGVTDVSGFPFPNHPAVSIGTGSKFSFFDLRARFYADSYVAITGQATNQCRSEGWACLDRASDLEPTSIRSASAPS